MDQKAGCNEYGLSAATTDWLRSTTGLQSLCSAWRTALHLCLKAGCFHGQEEEAFCSALKSKSSIINFRVSSEYVAEEIFYPDFSDEGTTVWGVELYLWIHSDLQDDWATLAGDLKVQLASEAWNQILRLSILDDDPNLVEIEEDHEGNLRSTGWTWTQPFSRFGNVEMTPVLGDEGIKRLCCCEDYQTLRAVIKPVRPMQTAEMPSSEYRFMGYDMTRFEGRLARALQQAGYLVILEPSMILPTPEVQNYRRPDLLVVDRGRSIVIEIDDYSHIAPRTRKPVEQWHRDRLMDRELLCLGIPVLRIYYTEIEEGVERVISKVTRVFEALGGQRMMMQ